MRGCHCSWWNVGLRLPQPARLQGVGNSKQAASFKAEFICPQTQNRLRRHSKQATSFKAEFIHHKTQNRLRQCKQATSFEAEFCISKTQNHHRQRGTRPKDR